MINASAHQCSDLAPCAKSIIIMENISATDSPNSEGNVNCNQKGEKHRLAHQLYQ